MSRYLNDVVRMYLDEMIDWAPVLRMQKGEQVDVDAERSALGEVLETAAAICAEIEPAAREGWEQASRLEDGQVIYPPHIQAGYDKLREAGLVEALGVAVPTHVREAREAAEAGVVGMLDVEPRRVVPACT